MPNFQRRTLVRRCSWLLCACCALMSLSALAHHSAAIFDVEHKITLTGAVREFQWTNPHSYIQLLVKNGEGKEVEWSLEMGGLAYLYNNGWRPSTLKMGDEVIVTVAPLRDGARGGMVLEVAMADGRTLTGSK